MTALCMVLTKKSSGMHHTSQAKNLQTADKRIQTPSELYTIKHIIFCQSTTIIIIV